MRQQWLCAVATRLTQSIDESRVKLVDILLLKVEGQLGEALSKRKHEHLIIQRPLAPGSNLKVDQAFDKGLLRYMLDRGSCHFALHTKRRERRKRAQKLLECIGSNVKPWINLGVNEASAPFASGSRVQAIRRVA